VADEEIGVVRHLYEAVNRGDWDRAAALLAGEVRWIPDNRMGLGPIYGKGDAVAFFRERTECSTTSELSSGGAGFEIRIGHVWTVRDGVVVRGEGYGDREEARAAASIRD
jgi:ketosteroid isomerase-like protein